MTDAPSKNQVTKAGATVRTWFAEGTVDEAAFSEAIDVIQRHRRAHARPLLAANVNLRYHCDQVGVAYKVTQRMKRMDTIIEKLERYPKMNLGRMQDFGGCRAVVENLDALHEVAERLQRRDGLIAVKDYVAEPRVSGYRAIHVISEYGKEEAKPIEVQIRTKYMHAWADMVEEISGYLGINYKQDHGNADFQEWARLHSEVLRLEELGEPKPDHLEDDYLEAWNTVVKSQKG